MSSPIQPFASELRPASVAAHLGWAAAMAAVVALSNWLVQYPITPWLTWGAFSYPIAFLAKLVQSCVRYKSFG